MTKVHYRDARYVATVFKYLKSFGVENQNISTFSCLDDEAIIPVGEPGIPVCKGVKRHKVLTPDDGPRLVCIDHDLHASCIVPSVSKIPGHSDNRLYE